MPAIAGANDTWAMNFVSDRLFDGRPFRILTIVDCHKRGALATCAMLDQWAYLNKIELDFSRPGKLTDNGFIEAFNGRLRAGCRNASWFISMADARQRIEEWRTDYNNERPHMALGGLTPKAYADQLDRARRFA